MYYFALASVGRLRDFSITVYTENPSTVPTATAAVCAMYSGPFPNAVTEAVPCTTQPVVGRYVRITDTPNEFLTLCEIQVNAVVSVQ